MKPIRLTTRDGLTIAANKLDGDLPTVIFMPGFFSNMEGTKARFLEGRCKSRGQAYIRFDYRGHGRSDGKFEDGTVTNWLNDTLLVLDKLAKAPVVAVGSSMGGWIALLAAIKRPNHIKGLVGVASSPDFTLDIYKQRMSDEQRKQMDLQGFITQPSDYREEPVVITKQLIDDGENHLLLHRDKLNLNIPVYLIHGKKDADVSWVKSEKIHRLLGEKNSKLILVPDGLHRLSREKDLALIDEMVQKISARIVN